MIQRRTQCSKSDAQREAVQDGARPVLAEGRIISFMRNVNENTVRLPGSTGRYVADMFCFGIHQHGDQRDIDFCFKDNRTSLCTSLALCKALFT